MANLVRWEPFRGMLTLRDAMDRLFEESFVRPFGDWPMMRLGNGFTPAVDMYETKQDVIVKASLPGLKPEDVDINITGNILTIRGETKEEFDGDRDGYHVRERSYGAFQRSLSLPVDVKTDEAEALFENGVLTLRLPKAEHARPKQIKIQTTKQIQSS